MELVKFARRDQISQLHQSNPSAIFYNTSTRAPLAEDLDYVRDASQFSPFNPYGRIPVPKTSYTSDSVEGVWQGLKIIKGRVDESYFKGKGRKRQGQPTGHKYGDKKLGYVQARNKIFLPTYKFMVDNRIPKEDLVDIRNCALMGSPQYFFDVDDNPDIHNTNTPHYPTLLY
jgi:hypothetical protein